MKRTAIVSGADLTVGSFSFSECRIGHGRCVRFQLAIERADAIENGACNFNRGDFPLPYEVRKLGNSEVVEVSHGA